MGGQNFQTDNVPSFKSLISHLSCIVSSGAAFEVAEDHECDYCETNFQNLQFLTYRHVIYIKKILISYCLQKKDIGPNQLEGGLWESF